MELLAFLVVVLAIPAIAGVAWLHFGQNTRVELTRSTLAPSNLSAEPEMAQGD